MNQSEDQFDIDGNNSKIEKVIDILSYDESLNYLYDESTKQEVDEILTQLGFQSLIPIFEIEKVDMYVFEQLDYDTIYGILKSFPWGIRRRFAIAYTEWKNNIFKKKSNCQLTVSQSSRDQINQNVTDASLAYILHNTDEGKEFLEQFNGTPNVLSLSEKRKLAATVINFYIEQGIVLSKKEVETLSKSIENYFPSESALEYCNANTGILYNRSKNSTNKYRKKGILEQPNSQKKIKLEVVKPLEAIENFSAHELDADTYIKANPLIPLQEIVNFWETSYRVRRHKMQQLKSFAEIIEQYKSFIRSDGWILVNSDFGKIIPNTNFHEKWIQNKAILFNVLKNNVSNALIKERFFSDNETNENSKSLGIIYGLNAFLYASGARKDPTSSKGKKIKDTILDSVQTMIIICKNQEAMQSDLLYIQKVLKEKGQTMQPLIVAFGINEKNLSNDFLIVFGNNFYKFSNFDKALEILLKLFYVFDLSFPAASHSVYCFLCSFFLEAKVEISYKVQSLINMLKAK
ncbi:hypothetical protein PVAND_005629 [Polypedilum vanderplanki]|uniref:Uncharacterized protein n=1 Tax=Polypedilum vanderplanki TaxID=319348 RepID=A0A9J6C131_POLVA|nr:hypothetical protein PVAND_005629 [Polypedilum vanderplanki]